MKSQQHGPVLEFCETLIDLAERYELSVDFEIRTQRGNDRLREPLIEREQTRGHGPNSASRGNAQVSG